ncbi:MAG: hypothetical protein AAFX99_30480 [Myxococcota bacterium]
MSNTVPYIPSSVKAHLLSRFEHALDRLIDAAQNQPLDLRTLELLQWTTLVPLLASLLASLIAIRCRAIAIADIERRSLQDRQGRWRLEAAYHFHFTTTLGPITVPKFAYRDLSRPATVTRTPAQQLLLPGYRHCRCSPYCQGTAYVIR